MNQLAHSKHKLFIVITILIVLIVMELFTKIFYYLAWQKGNNYMLKHNYMRQKERIKAFVNSNSSHKIICLGDSCTYGITMKPGDDYPSQLEKLLGSEYAVLNAGIPSEDSSDILKRYNRDLSVLKPEYLVLWAGWNNTWKYPPEYSNEWYWPFYTLFRNSYVFRTISGLFIKRLLPWMYDNKYCAWREKRYDEFIPLQFWKDLNELLVSSKKNNIKVLVLNLPSIVYTGDKTAITKHAKLHFTRDTRLIKKVLNSYNLFIEMGCRKNNLPLIDIREKITDGRYFIDMAHLNSEGYGIIADSIKNYIKKDTRKGVYSLTQ